MNPKRKFTWKTCTLIRTVEHGYDILGMRGVAVLYDYSECRACIVKDRCDVEDAFKLATKIEVKGHEYVDMEVDPNAIHTKSVWPW